MPTSTVWEEFKVAQNLDYTLNSKTMRMHKKKLLCQGRIIKVRRRITDFIVVNKSMVIVFESNHSIVFPILTLKVIFEHCQGILEERNGREKEKKRK